MNTQRPFLGISVAIVLGSMATMASADPLPGRDVLKFSQLPLEKTLIDGVEYFGHDNISSINGDHATGIYGSGSGIHPAGHFMADDFADTFDRDVVHIKWWGSVPIGFDNGSDGVQKFLVSFETDVPAGSSPVHPFSHPGEPILTQVLEKATGPLTPQSGTFTETTIGGTPDERLFEYNGELAIPFEQEADTVYWLKIVALIDEAVDGTAGLDMEWGWHNRDYTQQNLLASPAIIPGEADLGPGPYSPDTEIWHFQDNAVMGDIDGVDLFGSVPSGIPMTQPVASFMDTYYEDVRDGAVGINAFSQDLAFELYTTSVIPEPSTLMLAVLGPATFLFTTRRRRQRQA